MRFCEFLQSFFFLFFCVQILQSFFFEIATLLSKPAHTSDKIYHFEQRKFVKMCFVLICLFVFTVFVFAQNVRSWYRSHTHKTLKQHKNIAIVQFMYTFNIHLIFIYVWVGKTRFLIHFYAK